MSVNVEMEPITKPRPHPAAATPKTIIPTRSVSGDGRRATYIAKANVKQAM